MYLEDTVVSSEVRQLAGFARYEAEQIRLRRLCERMSRVAERVNGERSEYEALVQESVDRESRSVVETIISEARHRLESNTLEVGIFGSIKRGKSTLINALVGIDVSPMRVTPETAIPVWIESGPTATTVVLADGSVREDIDDETAREMCTQRYKPKDAHQRPIRVIQQRPIEWLPKGVRIVDTPGLDDPSMAEDYEQLTLAELDRVAAAVVVIVSPPGPGADEVKLLRSLGERSVDKLFLVCNFYPDHWGDMSIRGEMTDYLERVVAEGAGDAVDPTDVKVFPVAARAGLRAATTGDQDGFDRSGVGELREQLAGYLSGGALDRMTGFVERRIAMVQQLLADQLMQRRRVLLDPNLAGPIRKELADDISRSRLAIDEIRLELSNAAKEITVELVETLSRPFVTASAAVKSLNTVGEVDSLVNRLRIQYDTAVSLASLNLGQGTEIAYARVHRRLYEAFGITERMRADQADLGASLRQVNISAAAAEAKADWSEVAVAGLAGGAGTGLLAGSIAGGVGMALVVAGPVGWLIGMGLGALFGGGISAAAMRRAQQGRLDLTSRQTIVEEIAAHRSEVEARAGRAVRDWAKDAGDGLERLRAQYFEARENELRRVERIIADAGARERELRNVEQQLEELRAIVEER